LGAGNPEPRIFGPRTERSDIRQHTKGHESGKGRLTANGRESGNVAATVTARRLVGFPQEGRLSAERNDTGHLAIGRESGVSAQIFDTEVTENGVEVTEQKATGRGGEIRPGLFALPCSRDGYGAEFDGLSAGLPAGGVACPPEAGASGALPTVSD
jgi:hypothetical protein